MRHQHFDAWSRSTTGRDLPRELIWHPPIRNPPRSIRVWLEGKEERKLAQDLDWVALPETPGHGEKRACLIGTGHACGGQGNAQFYTWLQTALQTFSATPQPSCFERMRHTSAM